jgi:hypothetical protein
MDWAEKSLETRIPLNTKMAISLNFRRQRMIVKSLEKVST